MIVFDQVTKKFPNGTIALDSLTLHIQPKEFIFVTGHSGAGKTTLLRLLLREVLPTSGSIKFDQTDITKLKNKDIPLLRRQIGAIFQDFKLLSDRTVSENIALSLEIVGTAEAEIAHRVNHLLELVGLKGKGDLFPSQISGGELQRTVIARALAPEPKVLFADEPTGNLDYSTAQAIVQLLHDINELGTTVIMATHNQGIIDKFKNRTVELQHGKVIKDVEAKSKKPDRKE